MDTTRTQSGATGDHNSDAARLLRHLEAVQTDGTIPLDSRFLDECVTILPPQLQNNKDDAMKIIEVSAHLLPALQQDPTQLTRLLSRLVTMVSFPDIMSLDPPVDLVGGLNVQAGPFNGLILSVLDLATRTPADAAHLANMNLVVNSLVYLWLATPNMAVAEQAADVLLRLLRVDKEDSDVTVHGVGVDSGHGTRGQGLMWRRVFGDKDIYRMFFSIPSLSDTSESEGRPPLGKKEKSLAQGRLLSALPKLGEMDWVYVSRSHHPDVETLYGLDPSKDGLVDFILVHMADWKGDVLIHMHMIQVYAEIIKTIKIPSITRHISLPLEYLISRKLHERACSFWLDPTNPSHDSMDLQFLSGPSALYLATYLECFPEAFLSSSMVNAVLQRLCKALDISANQWSHGQSPAHSLHILASIPRVALLPQRLLGVGRRSSAFLQIPCRSTNVEALQTIAHVINGPDPLAETFPATVDPTASSRHASESAAARVLYLLYSAYHDTMFQDLISHATTVALPEVAIAAMKVMTAVATARWASLPSSSSYIEGEVPRALENVPTLEQLPGLFPTGTQQTSIPDTGIDALMQHGVREKFFPWLLKPPQSFAHLVGGRGDPESSAYRVAMAKWDLLQVVVRKLKHHAGRNAGSEQSTLTALQNRLAEGPWGASPEAGSRIGTLEL